jgi:hypothetical protein
VSYDEAEHAREEAEVGREGAEVAREQREDRRRIAEGGDDQHVSGNVQMYGRVEAEHDRRRSARVMYQRVAVLIALPLALVALIPSLIGLLLLHREVDRRCTDAAINRAAIRSSVTDSLRTLGYVYTADGRIVEHGKPLDYYLTHPEERQQQLASTKAALDRFPAIDCKLKVP